MERALKKRLYVYTIGMFLATVLVVSVITIYYEYRVRYMATTLYGVNKEAGKQLLYILFYGRQGNTVTADYSDILQEAGYTRNGAWYMFLYGGEYIPFAVIIGIMVILLAFAIYNIVKIGHDDVYSYMNKLKEDNENISKELDTYRTYMEKRNRQLQDFTENIAHQIKTPLTALSLSLDMMEEQLNARKTDVQLNSYISDAQSEVVSGKALTDTGLSSNEKLISNLGECFRQTYRIRDFITRLLKLSRMESGKIVLTEDDINVNEFINVFLNDLVHSSDSLFRLEYTKKEFVFFFELLKYSFVCCTNYYDSDDLEKCNGIPSTLLLINHEDEVLLLLHDICSVIRKFTSYLATKFNHFIEEEIVRQEKIKIKERYNRNIKQRINDAKEMIQEWE